MKAVVIASLVLCVFCLLSYHQPISSNETPHATNADEIVWGANAAMPNILLLVADDVGYEVPTYTGGESYETPNLDSLAWAGRQFTDATTCPNCSPSRQSFLTGKYNNQNYTTWGTLNPTEKTIGNMLKNAGYATAVSGKWQLDGGDAGIKGFGFSDYLVFLPFNNGDEVSENKGRYKNPILYQNGAYLPAAATAGKYADDMFVDFTSRFIDSVTSKTSKPFFVYHSFSLAHLPFTPTPDDPEYDTFDFVNGQSDTIFFPSMVKYLDKEVGKLMDTLKKKNLVDNTIVIFLGDNGTVRSIHSLWHGNSITGGKNSTNQYGTHVPFIVAGNGIKPGIRNNIIDLADLLPTLADMAGIAYPTNYGHLDGLSFHGAVYDLPFTARDTTYLYYKPMSGPKDKRFDVFARDARYKKYDDANPNSNFYDMVTDPLEQYPLTNLTPAQQQIKTYLQNVINTQRQYSLP